MANIPFNLYLIGEKNLFENEDKYLRALEECFDNGIKAFQLRQKEMTAREIINLGEKIKKTIERYKDISFFVNDRVDIALALGANGVHLNNNSVPIEAVKEKCGCLSIMYSSHQKDEAIIAEKKGADGITFSPIYKTKNQDFQQGIEPLKYLVNTLKIPVFALGGININNINEIKKSGAKYIAIQSGILKQKNIGSTVKSLINALNN